MIDPCFQERHIHAQPRAQSSQGWRRKLMSPWRHRSSPTSRENAGTCLFWYVLNSR